MTLGLGLVDWIVSFAKAYIVVCSGLRGVGGYLLYHPFDPTLEIDMDLDMILCRSSWWFLYIW